MINCLSYSKFDPMAGIYVVVSDTKKAGMRRGRGTGFDMGDMLSEKDFRMARFKPEKHSVMVRDATVSQF